MGLSTNAAAGVAGNIYQESGGNPSVGSSAGGGLFGETLANGGATGGGSMTEQLAALAAYIKKNGSIADVNAHASTPEAAAVYFMQRYERPNPALENEPNRVAAAQYVATAASSGNWGTSKGTNNPSSNPAPTGAGGFGIDFSGITPFFSSADTLVSKLMWLINPASWVRIGAFLAGAALLLIAVYAFIAIGEGSDNIMPSMPSVIPVPI
jgi:hypothetical protein